MSEASIFAIYQSLGGTKTMRQLDQLEKRLLRILAVQQQMERTGAVGDFEKTINQTAQQLKQLSDTFKEISRWIGQLTMVYLQPFVEKLLAGAIAFREILKSLNVAQGYQYESFGEGGLFGEIEEGANGATEAVESLKSVLLGFDKLNVLGSTSSTAGVLPDYDLLIKQIKKYSSGLENTKNKANEIAETILTWLGYTKKIETYTDEAGNKIENIVWELGEGDTKLSQIISTIKTIGITIGGLLIGKKISSLIGNLTKISSILGLSSGTLLLIVGIVTTIVIGFTKLYNSNEDFRNSVNTTFKSIKEKLSVIWQKIQPIIEKIGIFLSFILLEVFKKFEQFLAMVESIFTLDWEGFLKNFIDFTTIDVKGTFSTWKKAFEAIFEVSWDEVWNKFYNSKFGKFLFEGIPEFFSKTVPNFFIDLINHLGVGIEFLTNGVITVLNTVANGFIAFLNPIRELFKKNKWDYDPIGKINIGKVPRLATGGIIKSPTMAMVGEYSGASNNPEIVTPENLMRQVFMESMLPIAQAIVNGDQQLINAVNELSNRPIQLNGRRVSESIYDDLQRTAVRKGQMMFAK